MLLVETYIGESKIHGLGLFAKNKILKGTKIWELTPGIDIKIGKKQHEALPEIPRKYIHTYSYRDKITGDYVLTGDNDRFTNHSDNPNSKCIGFGSNAEITVALRDIAQNEEITVDYREIEVCDISFIAA